MDKKKSLNQQNIKEYDVQLKSHQKTLAAENGLVPKPNVEKALVDTLISLK